MKILVGITDIKEHIIQDYEIDKIVWIEEGNGREKRREISIDQEDFFVTNISRTRRSV